MAEPVGASPSPRRPRIAETYRPSGPGSPRYFSPPLRGGGSKGQRAALRGLGELERALVELVGKEAVRLGKPKPLPDPRCHQVAADLARWFLAKEQAPSEVLGFLGNHYGIVEAEPAVFAARGPHDPPGMLRKYQERLGTILSRGNWSRVGVATLRDGEALVSILALWEQNLELEPISRRLPSAGRAPVRGELLGGFRDPQMVVTVPNGSVRQLPLTFRGQRFEAQLRCTWGDGRYQVEMMASDRGGPMILANFPVYCGVEPPEDVVVRVAAADFEIDPAEAEQELLALINRDRQSAGLAPLLWDNRLAAIARAHSREMASMRYVAHISPKSGNAEDRVHRAGLPFRLILENVAQHDGVVQVHEGFMKSPGHRANVLNSHVTHVGIGIVVQRDVGGPIFVTELFVDERG